MLTAYLYDKVDWLCMSPLLFGREILCPPMYLSLVMFLDRGHPRLENFDLKSDTNSFLNSAGVPRNELVWNRLGDGPWAG